MRSPLLIFLAATVATSISTAQTPPHPLDPSARENARLQAASNSVAMPHLERLMQARLDLGLDANHTFHVVNANQDDLGWTHVRLQQYYGGLKVRNGSVISHADPAGKYSISDGLKRNIDVSTTPALLEKTALDIVVRQPGHLGAYSSPPHVELVIYPIGQAGGGTKEYRLAYEIQTVEGSEQSSQGMNAWIYHVDAQTGELLAAAPMTSTSIGTGLGKFNKNVQFITSSGGGVSSMFDSGRNYSTWDADYPTFLTPNVDPDNFWGDGLAFQGDASASAANRQTAMVDGHFGALVYWEMMSNVFGRQGPDGNKYPVNILAHYGTNWDDDEYSYLSGNVHLGDGKSRQALDCLGHELGHALNDFTAHVGGFEGDGLNESSSDIWGAMTTFYLNGGGFASQSKTMPLSGGSWTSTCSGRDLIKPSRSQGVADYWYLGLGFLEVHQRGEPNNRAFHFLAEGASALMTDPSYSERLPAGMQGIGTQDAARIWFDTLVYWLPGDADYGVTRNAAILASATRFGFSSPQTFAVMNAYAGIGVGTPAPNYPATQTLSEKEPNNTWQMATALPNPVLTILPKGSPPQHFLAKGTAGLDEDWFVVTVNAGQRMTVGVFPTTPPNPFPEVYQVEVLDQFLTSLGKASSSASIFNPVDVTSGSGFGVPQRFYMKVTRPVGGNPGTYELSVQYR